MEKMESQNHGVIFPKGEKAPADYFTGTVYLQMLAKKTESNDYSIGSVTFEPGARSNWHTHPAGQTLIVINGKGLYQEKGMPVKTINKGEAPRQKFCGRTPQKIFTFRLSFAVGLCEIVWFSTKENCSTLLKDGCRVR